MDEVNGIERKLRLRCSERDYVSSINEKADILVIRAVIA